MGLIKNFEKAWSSIDQPVFAPKDYLGWSVFAHKYPRFVYNFIGGDAIITIPPFPYAGESKKVKRTFDISKNFIS
jgi:hypothetical protein